MAVSIIHVRWTMVSGLDSFTLSTLIILFANLKDDLINNLHYDPDIVMGLVISQFDMEGFAG